MEAPPPPEHASLEDLLILNRKHPLFNRIAEPAHHWSYGAVHLSMPKAAQSCHRKSALLVLSARQAPLPSDQMLGAH